MKPPARLWWRQRSIETIAVYVEPSGSGLPETLTQPLGEGVEAGRQGSLEVEDIALGHGGVPNPAHTGRTVHVWPASACMQGPQARPGMLSQGQCYPLRAAE